MHADAPVTAHEPARTSVAKPVPSIGETVTLHVYSIAEQLNRLSLAFGVGLYHTAVEVYGQEHSFIGHPFRFSGIVSTTPKAAAYFYQEGLHIGKTRLTVDNVGRCLRELGEIFTGSSYHLLHNNCNHFSSKLIKRLCNGKLPAYINRAANSVCCFPFLDTMFSIKTDSERFFVEVLYLTFNGDMSSVMSVLDVSSQANLPRYVSYIEAAFQEHSIPQCLPYSPVIKSYNPFAPSTNVVELVRRNLCANLIFYQSKNVYDLAFDLSRAVQARGSKQTTLANYPPMTVPTTTLDQERSSSADYPIDIHRVLDQLQRVLIETIGERTPQQGDDIDKQFEYNH